MAEIVLKVLERSKITDRLYCITTDNAGSNGTLRRELDDMLKELRWTESSWDSAATKIPCIAHVIQLVVKAMLKTFNIRPGERGNDDDDDDEPFNSNSLDNLEENKTVASAIQKVS